MYQIKTFEGNLHHVQIVANDWLKDNTDIQIISTQLVECVWSWVLMITYKVN